MPVIINRAFIYILFTNLFLLALVHLSPLVYPGFWEFLEKMSVFLRRNFAVLFVLFFILAFLPKFLKVCAMGDSKGFRRPNFFCAAENFEGLCKAKLFGGKAFL